MSDIRKIQLNSSKVFAEQKPSLLGKFLPFMLIVSFVFANFYYVAQDMTLDFLSLSSQLFTLTFFLELIFMAVLDYLVLLFMLWLYRLVMSYRPYYYLVKTQTFNETIKFWYFVRNVVYGFFTCLLFFFPYLEMYLYIIELILSFLVILLTYFSVKKYVDIMFRHMYFKLLMYPWFIWQAVGIILTIILGGY